MSRLSEPIVKISAVEFLEKEYTVQYKLNKIYKKIEAPTIPKLNGIADGFLCFNSSIQNNHTVSIEAKSHKTLLNLKPYMDVDKYLIHLSILSSILAIAPFYFFSSLSWYWIMMLYICFTVIILITISYISSKMILEPLWYKTADVIKQINRYPANEKWIAISKDSINLLKIRKPYLKGCNYDNLMVICQKKGIGVIVINKIKPHILLKPKFKKGKFLSCYNLRDFERDNT